MSSFNPFTNQRKKREEKLHERLAEYEEAQMAMQQAAPPPQLAAADPSFSIPQREVSYDADELNKYLPQAAQTEQAVPAALANWQGTTTYEPPSRARQCFTKLQSGFMLGGALGGAIGFLYGTFAAVRYRHVLYLPIAVVQFGAGFGFFLACGTVIRCDELKPQLERRAE
mmetsp:Transcript_39677/g.92749  ORF Transcript_39677/g.92749 Transcript_39677/m.92749 type:complete len:170 (-) Transcript_39677:94-603(-)|eukprot:CAMPEP_0119374686 /NCGR_PEP_ID=MMETSP1334-20130426/32192_1 /TAXON_ID=127549 /ORGANISM="Calcidiscus leptoporus, Strain RCC1130" /LENGTH=169 /DNA_ID=CAMNT_0007392817 /DNA_START=81 /DNA_END=590 /DNA_ORIENTATION=+